MSITLKRCEETIVQNPHEEPLYTQILSLNDSSHSASDSVRLSTPDACHGG